MSLSLDACEILMHLNEMGYRNITAEQLKEFMRDLKKLIKYEGKLTAMQDEEEALQRNKAQELSNCLFDKLHKTSTAASRAKLYKNTPVEKNKENLFIKMPDKYRVSSSTSDNKLKTQRPQSAVSESSNKMWIRTKLSTTSKMKTSSDPVALYHAYQKEWKKFKPRFPGENDHSDLRWAIREKLMGHPSSATSSRHK